MTSPAEAPAALAGWMAARRAMVEDALDRVLPAEDAWPATIHRAVRYSLFAGGKRIRPLLALASAEAAGGTPDDAMPLVQVRVGGIDYPVTLDTGSSGTLKLFDPDRVGPTKPVAGVRGEASVVVDKVPSLTFGPLSLTDLEISYGAPNLGETPGARQGNLGNGVLQHVVLTLDYPSRRMTVCAGGAS